MNCASASFAALYRAHFDFTWRNLRRLGVAHGDVDDAAQEVFVVLLRKRASLPPELPIRTWLFGVIRRIAWRYRRGRARRDRLCDAVERAPSVATRGADPTARDDPDEAYDRREAARLLDRFLDGLTPAQREVFVLAELEQLSGKEIAAVLAVNQNTVWSRLRSARQAFDRSFAAIRAEHRRLADRDPAALRERAALSLSRRAHRPTEEDRRRVGALLGIPVFGPGAGGLEVLGQPSPVAAVPGARGLASLLATSPVRAGLLSVALAGATVGLLGLDSQARAPAPAAASSTPPSEAPAA
ncbi:MAG: sigma-70 family RNA polymerase sigma factor, partial [Myxococcales bacterium]|nr:sigma-70 family RNA polymerase sigma factor [Myxococcales bacterium]